ncbi:MAG: DUF4332 domain-containing protein [Actinomycetota bacterium]|nr:DUF4332 domain-containing protein [Actinomycetota bacterium]
MRIRTAGLFAATMFITVCLSASLPAGVRAADDMAAECADGFALLASGQPDAAADQFELALDDEACGRGLDLADRQREAADDELKECTALAKKAADAASDTFATARTAALAACAEVVRLDRSFAGKVDEQLLSIEASVPDGDDALDDATEWWSDGWSNAQTAATVVGQGLLVVVIAMPLLNAIGVGIGRRGWRRARKFLRTHVLVRSGVALALAAAIVTALSSNFGDRTWLVGLTVVGFVLLGWVLAQRRRVRFDRFAGVDGSSTPGSPVGPVIATELARLTTTKGGSVEVVDPFAAAELDTDAIGAISGPENKLVAALVKLFRALLQPGPDLVVTGQLIAAGKKGEGIVVQLKHGRRTLASEVIYAAQFAPKSAAAPAGKSETKDVPASASSHADLARPAAIWVLMALLREFEGNELGAVAGLEGATHWRGLALQAAAIEHVRAGALEQAKESYAKAWDTDPTDRATRLGFALMLVRTASPDDLEAVSGDLVQTARDLSFGAVTKGVEPTSVHVKADATGVLALHAMIVAKLNLFASRAAADGSAAVRDAEGLDQVRQELAMLDAVLKADTSPLDSESLAKLRDSCASMKPFAQQLSPGLEQEFLATALQSIRGKYNVAAYLATPLVRPRREGDEQASLSLLRAAVAHPTFASYAKTDPFFDSMRKNASFQKLVHPSVAPVRPSGLAGITVIGEHYSALLAAHEIDSLDELAEQSDERLQEYTSASPGLIRSWKAVASLDALPGIGARYANLLYLCGVRSVADLAGRNAVALRQLMDSLGLAVGVSRVPSAATVQAWITSAGAEGV